MAPAPASNTAPILALVGAEILALGAFVAVCEVRTSDVQLCEHRWALALPAIALAGQSAATYFMDSRAGSPGHGGVTGPPLPLPPPSPLPSAPPRRNRRGQFTRPHPQGADALVE
ncbi:MULTISPECIES: hypothetical protein [unclassified Cyanobium]|uniref:hypothetical protein n=1 Tax=unclassified Cyanobium TaxID=2627006 RepID=UPI0020CF45E3|nr:MULTISPECIES: hypothetical protein [unclassified Cyanobium]MCP9860371.1 hypothetical protein [Cyanobium sp. Cruz-8H5]MCP9867645.1 hypothetical protein [Cyanobium sp. Cruz-8D1]